MYYFDVKELRKKEVKPGMTVCSVFLENLMITHFEFQPYTDIPTHQHMHEQITYVLEGELKFWVETEIRVLKAGEGVIIPPHMLHGAIALSHARVIDAWNPVREDYIVP